MDLSHRLAISYYKTIATLNESHHVFLVQHASSKKIFIKKILDVYNLDVYRNLYRHPIPGTPRLIEYCEEKGKLYLIEEYISGDSLSDKLLAHEINSQDALSYALDLCDILEQLHAFNPPVIHRDIKPSNIIISSYNRALLLDFNAAKQFSSDEEQDTVLLGTQGYAAPEQYGFGSSSPQTDIYSLGIVIREMLTACPDTSKKLEEIANRCSQLSPKERYSSIQDVKEALLSSAKQEEDTSLQAKGSLPSLLPPGYRSHTPWKMFLSSLVYIFVFLISFTLEPQNTTGTALWLERVFFLAIMLSVIFGAFNYLNIQNLMPLCQSKNRRLVRYLGIALLDFILVFVLLSVLFLIEKLVRHVV